MEIVSLRNQIHWRRRLLHMAGGAVIALAAHHIDSKRTLVLCLVSISSIAVAMELWRLSWDRLNEKFIAYFGDVMRAGEESQFSGLAHYCLGCTIAAIVFPRSIAILSILYLAFGDPMAAIAGVKYGKHFLSRKILDVRKSIEGSLACFALCTVMTFILSFYLGGILWLPWGDRILFSLLGGFGAMIGEILPLRTDDNLALPLISGAFLWLTSAVFQLIPGLYF